jgi:hypothetical protein
VPDLLYFLFIFPFFLFVVKLWAVSLMEIDGEGPFGKKKHFTLIYYYYREWANEVKPNDQGEECWLICQFN